MNAAVLRLFHICGHQRRLQRNAWHPSALRSFSLKLDAAAGNWEISDTKICLDKGLFHLELESCDLWKMIHWTSESCVFKYRKSRLFWAQDSGESYHNGLISPAASLLRIVRLSACCFLFSASFCSLNSYLMLVWLNLQAEERARRERLTAAFKSGQSGMEVKRKQKTNYDQTWQFLHHRGSLDESVVGTASFQSSLNQNLMLCFRASCLGRRAWFGWRRWTRPVHEPWTRSSLWWKHQTESRSCSDFYRGLLFWCTFLWPLTSETFQ